MPDTRPRTVLHERDRERRHLAERCARLRADEGSVIVLRAPAGMGKTELLRAALTDARGGDLRVLTARAGEVERHLAYGVVRQLFAPAVLLLAPTELEQLRRGPAREALRVIGAEPDSAGVGFDAVAYGLYWLLVSLGEDRPVVIAVDDLHWADGPSLRFLDFLSRRLESLPALAVATLRPGEQPEDPPALDRLLSSPVTEVLDVQPLSPAAVGAMAAEVFDEPPDPDFTEACHRATAGNALFVHALLRELRDDGRRPRRDTAASVGDYGPSRLGAWLRARLSTLGSDAEAVAVAVAVLGRRASLPNVAALAGLEAAAASRATDLLVATEVLTRRLPVTFRHPIIRQVLLADVGDHQRAMLHAAAARLLVGAGAPAEEVAAHALQAPPSRDPDVVAELQRAAADATARGAPEVAVRYLRRAIEEPPPPDLRRQLLRELGGLLLAAGDPDGVGVLEEAYAEATDAADRARTVIPLMHALVASQRMDAALQLVVRTLEELGDADRDLVHTLEAESAAWVVREVPGGRWIVDRVEQHAREASGATRGERLLLANLAFKMVLHGDGSAERCADYATKAYADGRLLDDVSSDAPSFAAAVTSLAHADRLDLADAGVAAALAEARGRGSALGFGYASILQAGVAERHGRIAEMEAAARSALDLADLNDWMHLQPMALHFLVTALLERGAVAEADEVLTRHGYGSDTAPTPLAVTASRASVRLRQGRYQAALDDILGARSLGAWWMGGDLLPWRSEAARAMYALGRGSDAREMAAEELALADRWGTAWVRGIALRGLALVTEGEDRLSLLREAVEVTAGSSALVPHARALADLGASLRRTRRRAAAREPLNEAAELALACGATALLDQVNDELAAAGAPPRHRPETGTAALTPTQRRIAAMAAGGMTNRQIGQELFVSLKTVESHLSAVFRKLEVGSRAELRTALADASVG